MPKVLVCEASCRSTLSGAVLAPVMTTTFTTMLLLTSVLLLRRMPVRTLLLHQVACLPGGPGVSEVATAPVSEQTRLPASGDVSRTYPLRRVGPRTRWANRRRRSATRVTVAVA